MWTNTMCTLRHYSRGSASISMIEVRKRMPDKSVFIEPSTQNNITNFHNTEGTATLWQFHSTTFVVASCGRFVPHHTLVEAHLPRSRRSRLVDLSPAACGVVQCSVAAFFSCVD